MIFNCVVVNKKRDEEDYKKKYAYCLYILNYQQLLSKNYIKHLIYYTIYKLSPDLMMIQCMLKL